MGQWRPLIAFRLDKLFSGGGLEGSVFVQSLPNPAQVAFAVGNLVNTFFGGLFGKDNTPTPEQIAAANLATEQQIDRRIEEGREGVLENEDFRFPRPVIDISNPILREAAELVLEDTDVNDPQLGDIIQAQADILAEQQRTDEELEDERDNDISILESILTNPVIQDIAIDVASPDIGGIGIGDPLERTDTELEPVPQTQPEEEEQNDMPNFNVGGIVDILGDIFEGGFGDIPGVPDGMDVIQGIGGIIDLFGNDDTSTVPTVTTSGETVMATTSACGTKAPTALQQINMVQKANCRRGVSSKKVKSMARTCGLDVAAATLGVPVTLVCQVVATPTRRRSGISSADMRKTRSTIR